MGSTSVFASSLTCSAFLETQVNRAYPDEPIRMMSLNALNLHLLDDKFGWEQKSKKKKMNRRLTKKNSHRRTRKKPEHHTKALAEVILETSPQFISLQEVSGIESLNIFNKRYLKGRYKVYFLTGARPRHTGIAFLARKDLKVDIKTRSHQDLVWINRQKKREQLFTRDFPIFEVYVQGQKTPNIIVAGVHLKARMNRPNDPKSFYKRNAEIAGGVEILKNLKKKNPKASLVIMGDFNSSRGQQEVHELSDNLKLFDPHLSKEHFVDEGGLGKSTFVYFPREGGTKEREFDRALLSSDLHDKLISSWVYRYKDSYTGETKQLPRSMEERDQNPSDHYPILFDLKPEALYGER